MSEKISQIAASIPMDNNNPDKQHLVINGYHVIFSFSKEHKPEVFERIRDILLATSYTKKAG